MITTITGNATRDAELRFAASGTAVCNVGVAINQRENVAGEWKDGPTWFIDVVAFKKLAEDLAEAIHKSDKVIATGDLRMREWEDKSGQKRQSFELVATEVGKSILFASSSQDRPAQSKTTNDPWA